MNKIWTNYLRQKQDSIHSIAPIAIGHQIRKRMIQIQFMKLLNTPNVHCSGPRVIDRCSMMRYTLSFSSSCPLYFLWMPPTPISMTPMFLSFPFPFLWFPMFPFFPLQITWFHIIFYCWLCPGYYCIWYLLRFLLCIPFISNHILTVILILVIIRRGFSSRWVRWFETLQFLRSLSGNLTKFVLYKTDKLLSQRKLFPIFDIFRIDQTTDFNKQLTQFTNTNITKVVTTT